jgi:hypothetical protein
MRTTNASKYLPQMGLDPLTMVSCAAAKCETSFVLVSGFAIEAFVGKEASIAFFCSAACFLHEVPVNCCARA